MPENTRNVRFIIAFCAEYATIRASKTYRYMATPKIKNPFGSKLKIATAEVKRVKSEGPLYYILPPVLVLAVIIFCYTATPPKSATQSSTAEPATTQE